MSIRSEITRINNNIAAAYSAAESKGATMPATENSANLADTVASIPEAVQPTLITKQIIENGTYTAENDNADGYSDVTVDVPDESKAVLDSLIDRTITTITSDATSIGSNAFSNCASLTKANFPNVTSIGRNAFNSCSSLTEASFPNATSISSNAFNSCSSLTEASFPETTSIDAYAFYSCASLTEVSFPKVTSIGSNAFRNCSRLQYFDMSEVDKPPIITTNTFYGTTCIFLFRDQTQLDEYASATNWSALADRFQIKGVTS